MQVTWNISQLDRRTSDGFVTCAHWTVSAQDGEFSASSYGTCGWGEGQPVTPYDSLTEADVLAWVWESVNKEETEASLASQIEALKHPTQASGLPWSTQTSEA